MFTSLSSNLSTLNYLLQGLVMLRLHLLFQLLKTKKNSKKNPPFLVEQRPREILAVHPSFAISLNIVINL
jgi:hypothetical protein